MSASGQKQPPEVAGDPVPPAGLVAGAALGADGGAGVESDSVQWFGFVVAVAAVGYGGGPQSMRAAVGRVGG